MQHNMALSIRKSPIICLLVSLKKILVGRLTYSKDWIGTPLKLENGEEYHIFRHITSLLPNQGVQGSVFIVRFMFARLSQKANIFVSQFPMLFITGFPGFRRKMYAVNIKNGYWLGLYEWESKQALEDYKRSFVLKVMNKRAINGSVSYREFENHGLIDYLKQHQNALF
jgi:hypothetical protein